MWHMYDGYHFFGMHLIWWIIWILLVLWIFFTPYGRPAKKAKKESPLQVLQRRFASGEITREEYEERKAILERDKTDK